MTTIGFPFGIPTENGSVPVLIQDQHSEIIDLHLTRFIDDLVMTQDADIDDTTIYVSCNTAPVAGNTVCLKESSAFYQSTILSVTPTGGTNYTLVMSSPLDFAYTTNGGCSLNDERMNVNGSVTPVIFRLSPSGLTDPNNLNISQKWDITRIMLYIRDDAAMDDARFGSIVGGLANGIILRKKDGIYKNIFNAKTNGDLALHAYDVTYIDSTLPPAGFYSMRVRRSFSGPEKNGVTIRLDADGDDELQLIVRDDLTSQSSFYAVAQGHIVETALPYSVSTVDIQQNSWVKVAENKKSGMINLVGSFFKPNKGYLISVGAGEDAPTIPPSNSSSNAVPTTETHIPFSSSNAIDIYVWSDYIDIYAVVSAI